MAEGQAKSAGEGDLTEHVKIFSKKTNVEPSIIYEYLYTSYPPVCSVNPPNLVDSINSDGDDTDDYMEDIEEYSFSDEMDVE